MDFFFSFLFLFSFLFSLSLFLLFVKKRRGYREAFELQNSQAVAV